MLKKIIREIRNVFIRMSMVAEDDFWFNTGGDGELFPPSFFATHTEEEVKEIYEREIAELRERLKKYNLKDPYIQDKNSVESDGTVINRLDNTETEK